MSSIVLAPISSASYVDNLVSVQLPTSTANGYSNTVNLYTTPNIISVPAVGNLAVLGVQANSQVQMLGYADMIIDDNYSIAAGEITIFSTSWYLSTRSSGVEIQEAQTSNIENSMMGQSTNLVLLDILDILVQMNTFLGIHTHTGVTTGIDDTGIAVQVPPVIDPISEDVTYITANSNLAITGSYEPKTP